MKKSTVMIVEDNPITRKMVRVAMQCAGLDVLEAPDGKSAIALLEQSHPDLILQDLVLPDIGGLELRDKLAERTGHKIPIIAVSGSVNLMEEARTRPEQFSDYLLKPVEPSVLLETVRFYLAQKQATGLGAGAGKRVLVVDDNSSQRKLFKLILENIGFAVDTAADGLEALESARRNPPDAVVSDILMPRCDGYGLCQSLRGDQQLSRIPIILISSVYTNHEDQEFAIALGASAHVVRSANGEEVVQALLRSMSEPSEVQIPGTGATAPLQDPRLERLSHETLSQARRLSILESGLGIISNISEILGGQERGAAGLVKDLLPKLLDAAGLSRGAAYLWEREGGELSLAAHIGFGEGSIAEVRNLFGCRDLFHRVVRDREAILLGNPLKESRSLFEAGGRSVVLAPMNVGGECLGILFFVTWGVAELERDWLPVAKALGTQVGQVVSLHQALGKVDASERQYQLLMDHAADGIFILDAEGRIREMNPSAEKLLGYSCKELRGKPYQSVVSEQGMEWAQFQYAALLERGTILAQDIHLRRADGSTVQVDFSSSVIPGNRPTVLAIAHDNTQRKKSEEALAHSQEQLRQAQKMEAVGRLAGGVAHDFNNLLTVINGYSQLVIDQPEIPEPARKDLQEVRRAGERAAGLTRQLLAFSRKQVLQPRLLSLDAVVRDVEKMLRRLIGEDIELVTPLSGGQGRVKGDQGQIEQVIMNLAVNARDAMPDGGTLEISTSEVDVDQALADRHLALRTGSYMVLSVRDTGTGMDEGTKARLFEPFFTTKETGKGTGLGLATVQGIVTQSGGCIWVYSELGTGTVFKIYLPLVAEKDDLSPPASPRNDLTARRGETILLVEDDPTVRMLSKRFLETYGYEVLEAENGVHALTLAQASARKINLVLTDIVMPKMKGPDLVARLAASYPELKVIYMSGYTHQMISRDGVLAKGSHLLEKPFTVSALGRKVREVLDATDGKDTA